MFAIVAALLLWALAAYLVYSALTSKPPAEGGADAGADEGAGEGAGEGT